MILFLGKTGSNTDSQKKSQTMCKQAATGRGHIIKGITTFKSKKKKKTNQTQNNNKKTHKLKKPNPELKGWEKIFPYRQLETQRIHHHRQLKTGI